ncbi:hypothetical protein A4U88_2908 [Serratia marcescens]|nr:hypothetical protein A4U88_2908 [Serratia marcescens]AXK23101.1 Hypothetical protein SmN45_1306 [Serratia marcescens]
MIIKQVNKNNSRTICTNCGGLPSQYVVNCAAYFALDGPDG